MEVVEPLEYDHLFLVPPGEPVGAGPIDVLAHPPVEAERFDGAAVDDGAGGIGKLRQEVLFRLVYRDADGALVHDDHAGDLLCLTSQLLRDSHDVAEVTGSGVTVEIRVGSTLYRVLHVLSGDGSSVVERYPVAESECVDHPRVVDLPTLSEVRHDLKVAVDVDETSEQARHVEMRSCLARDGRVECGGLSRAA